jgi:hypothetical protein
MSVSKKLEEDGPFRSDCRISLVILERGKPAKLALGCSWEDESGKARISYRKFLGKALLRESILEAIFKAFELAKKLHKRKPELCMAAEMVPLRISDKRILKLCESFDSYRMRPGTEAELHNADDLANRAFTRDKDKERSR